MIRSRRSRGAGGGGRGRASPRFGAENTLTDVLTIPVTSATLRSTMKQDLLNNYLLMLCHKSITDTLDTVKIACANEQRKGHFEKFEEGYAYV